MMTKRKEIYPRDVRTRAPQWVFEELERRALVEDKTFSAVVREQLIRGLRKNDEHGQ